MICRDEGCDRRALPNYTTCEAGLRVATAGAFGRPIERRAVVRRLSAEDPTLQIVGRRGQS